MLCARSHSEHLTHLTFHFQKKNMLSERGWYPHQQGQHPKVFTPFLGAHSMAHPFMSDGLCSLAVTEFPRPTLVRSGEVSQHLCCSNIFTTTHWHVSIGDWQEVASWCLQAPHAKSSMWRDAFTSPQLTKAHLCNLSSETSDCSCDYENSFTLQKRERPHFLHKISEGAKNMLPSVMNVPIVTVSYSIHPFRSHKKYHYPIILVDRYSWIPVAENNHQ